MHTYTLYTSISLIGLYTCMKKGRLVYCYRLGEGGGGELNIREVYT